MAISLENLRQSSVRFTSQRIRSLTEAKARNLRTGFLCHSHKDSDAAHGLVTRLREEGLELYVDWLDETMPDRPNRETAMRIQRAIRENDFFLFLATPNSMKSVWCPWEIGYADGMKPIDSIVVIPTVDTAGTHSGNEYLQLYQRIDEVYAHLHVFRPNQVSGVPLRTL